MAINKSRLWFIVFGISTANLLLKLDYVFCQTPYYHGKTIRIIQGSPAGGTGDLRVKVTSLFLQKHIPGNPLVISEYMPGAGGRKAANYLYSTARPDGLTIGSPGSTFIPSAVLGETGVAYDVTNLFTLVRTAVKPITFCSREGKPV